MNLAFMCYSEHNLFNDVLLTAEIKLSKKMTNEDAAAM
jgi:hypothetical protein